MRQGESQTRGGRGEKLGGVTPTQKLQRVPANEGIPRNLRARGPRGPSPDSGQEGTRKKQTGGRARYPEGGCLLLSAPRSRPGDGGPGTGSAASAVAPAPAPAEQPERPQLHAPAQAPGAPAPRVSFRFLGSSPQARGAGAAPRGVRSGRLKALPGFPGSVPASC